MLINEATNLVVHPSTFVSLSWPANFSIGNWSMDGYTSSCTPCSRCLPKKPCQDQHLLVLRCASTCAHVEEVRYVRVEKYSNKKETIFIECVALLVRTRIHSVVKAGIASMSCARRFFCNFYTKIASENWSHPQLGRFWDIWYFLTFFKIFYSIFSTILL